MYSTLTPIHGFIIQRLQQTYCQAYNDEPVSGHNRGVHKNSSHENSSEIDHEKQNKTHVQKKITATETGSTEFQHFYLTPET